MDLVQAREGEDDGICFLTEELESHSTLRQLEHGVLLLQRRGREAQASCCSAAWTGAPDHRQEAAASQARAALL